MHVALEMNLSSKTWKCDIKSVWNVKDASISCLNLAHNIFVSVISLNTFFDHSLKTRTQTHRVKTTYTQKQEKISIWPNITIYKGGLLITFVSYFYQSASFCAQQLFTLHFLFSLLHAKNLMNHSIMSDKYCLHLRSVFFFFNELLNCIPFSFRKR